MSVEEAPPPACVLSTSRLSTSSYYPSTSSLRLSRRRLSPPPPCSKPPNSLPSLGDDAVSIYLDTGLQTPPPSDDMSTAYHPAMPAYDGRAIHGYPSAAMAHPSSRSRPVVNDVRASSQQYRCPPQQQQQQQQPPHAAKHGNHHQLSDLSSRRSTRTSTPSVDTAMAAKHDANASRPSSETLIYHSSQIPRCISPEGGNLSDFAAQMTCLFWFDSAESLKRAETIRTRPSNISITRLPTLAKPYDQFRKWVYNVLTTTQVTQNVIILALLFIYRLKMSTPQIKGRAGSEYRLLTVALMLGNKFLDDNTYTNKTWAEVSCFAVQEIHVMEVEFLSNMRYNLLASKDEWEGWLVKLACFHEYYERALKLPASPIRHPSPANIAFGSPGPSPTAASLPAAPDLGPYASSVYSPSPSHPKTLSAYQVGITSPLTTSKPLMGLAAARKRSPEEELADHPPKRQVPPRPAQVVTSSAMGQRPGCPVDGARLPVPPLTIVTNHARNMVNSFTAANGYHPQMAAGGQQVVSLPPLQSGIRAMPGLYPSAAQATIAQQQQPPQQQQQSVPQAALVAPLPTTPYCMAPLAGHAAMGYGTPTKHHSPGSLGPFGSSPLMDHLGPGSAGVHTPMSSSPSVYLQQRNSPYKPIRHVNTLLYPPPSASLDQYHLSVPVQPNQMHYQPLGRRHDVRTGVVPEFLVFNRGQQQHLASQGGRHGHYPS
ncbi:hypothetical protein XA68_14280 [Ophiocordyceps unilateralis]|uniref:Cyclin N-terminal domain-containing protein n=1 Tax=Ophiocordyceps unilateralis TaxID=268505 RepID=A0A2A9PLB1_OPHUN|nr:hypothetical protein XA68_14280 [Ophiocordyceps unilateralis]